MYSTNHEYQDPNQIGRLSHLFGHRKVQCIQIDGYLQMEQLHLTVR
jgi:hypothetical protein